MSHMSTALQAVSAPRRQAILRLVWDRERSAGEIHAALADVTFGAVSQHLKVLESAGAVSARRDGRRRLYQARPEALGPLASWLESMWGDALWKLKIQAEMEEARRGPRTHRRRRR
jgi:DNA-binding transcriptional ArsR family regulator